MITLLTGPRGIGKSTLCLRVVERLRRAGVQVTGLTTQHIGVHDLAVTELVSGITYPLTLPFDASGGLLLGRFRIDIEALSRSQCALRASVPTQVLVLDEVGPLELLQHQGWVIAFDLLRQAEIAMALVVVRPELLIEAMEAFGVDTYTVIYLTERNRDRLVETIGGLAVTACSAQSQLRIPSEVDS